MTEPLILKSENEESSDNTESYAPDRELPRTEHGEPDANADGATGAHTQLGKKKSRKGGTYRQAREFDKDGKPVRDIDFTDHGRPKEHPNPQLGVVC